MPSQRAESRVSFRCNVIDLFADVQTDLMWPSGHESPSVIPSSARSSISDASQTDQTCVTVSGGGAQGCDSSGGGRPSRQSPPAASSSGGGTDFVQPQGRPPGGNHKGKKKPTLKRPPKLEVNNRYDNLKMQVEYTSVSDYPETFTDLQCLT